MDGINYNLGNIIFSLDIGTRSVIGTVGIVKDNKFQVIAESYVEHEERAMLDGQIHDITLVANAVGKVKKDLENKLNFTLSEVAIAAAGRFLRTVTVKAEMKLEADREIDREIVRSLELTTVKKAEERVNKHTEGKLYFVGYSVKNYYLNGYVITNLLSHKGETVAAEVIATFLPRSVVDSLYAVMNKVQLQVVSLTLEPIAAMEAAVPKNLRILNLVLIDVGAGTSDIAISQKDSISAYGMVPLAGDEVTESIAQKYLVDFNTAERMKRQIKTEENISFTDVLGFDNVASSKELIDSIKDTVNNIAKETAKKVIELNGGKSPNAVFLVGGGAHTPLLKEYLAEKLELPAQRIGIKGREAVTDCVCTDMSLGSTGVTVLGIALVTLRRLGSDFIDITLNGSMVSLFNTKRHTVMDVILQAGVSPRVLIGKNGKNLKFVLNGIKRVAFGMLSESAVIKINGRKATIDTYIKEGDKIDIEYAKDGQIASAKPVDYLQKFDTISFNLDGQLIYLEPICRINGKRADFQTKIKEGDEIEIVLPKTFGDFRKYYDKCKAGVNYLKDGKFVLNDYEICEGDIIYCENEEIKQDVLEKKESTNNLSIIVNGEKMLLSGKDSFVFVDIFNFIDFDRSRSKGNLILLLNGKNANFNEKLKENDEIKIYWE